MDNDPTSRNTPEKIKLDDNARKFTSEVLTTDLLDSSSTSYVLITDWLETGEDNEKKLAYKRFNDGSVQILLIQKVTKDGKRTSEKQLITEEQYEQLLHSSVLRVEKVRYEFTYPQDGALLQLKYDDFGEDKLRVLEVDAQTDQDRDSFDPETFPAELIEVTGDMSYYGYRVAEHI